ncbi:unnamed protein product [Soboliphyme baturini]|uniref:Uncharacterized protein n=1 Tax=Soboliphyme baturini TaxID=241478 RepID=A0A183J830_9BILA|nr:unnamed protein product [Soboliphyme baturini]
MSLRIRVTGAHARRAQQTDASHSRQPHETTTDTSTFQQFKRDERSKERRGMSEDRGNTHPFINQQCIQRRLFEEAAAADDHWHVIR